MLRKSLKLTALMAVLAVAAMAATTIPAGTKITVRTGSQINSGTAKVGQKFDANLTHDLVVNGKTLAKSGFSSLLRAERFVFMGLLPMTVLATNDVREAPKPIACAPFQIAPLESSGALVL